MDDPGQQTAETYRPSRAKGDLLSFHLSTLSSPSGLLPPLSSPSVIFIFLWLLSPSQPSALYTVLSRLNTNLDKWTQNNFNILPQLSNTLPRTNTCTYVQSAGTQTHSCSVHVLNVAWNMLICFKAPKMVQRSVWTWIQIHVFFTHAHFVFSSTFYELHTRFTNWTCILMKSVHEIGIKSVCNL